MLRVLRWPFYLLAVMFLAVNPFGLWPALIFLGLHWRWLTIVNDITDDEYIDFLLWEL